MHSGSISYTYSNSGCSTGSCSGGAADKVIKEVTPLGAIDYTYDAIGRRTSMTVAGQPTVSYSYDSNSRLTGINTLINSVGQGFSLAYDAVGRRCPVRLSARPFLLILELFFRKSAVILTSLCPVRLSVRPFLRCLSYFFK